MTKGTSSDAQVIPYQLCGDQPSWLYRVWLDDVEIPVTQTPVLAPEDYERITAAYAQMPPYCWVDEARFAGVHTAHAACAGNPQVKVSVQEEFTDFRIHPQRRGIQGRKEGRSIHFQATSVDPRYYLVNIPDLPLLCIFIDPPEEDIPARDAPDVVDLQPYLEPSIDLAEAMQRAAQVINGQGKTLFVPRGEYLSDTIQLRQLRDCKIYFEPGALIRTRICEPGENIHRHGLWIDDCQDLIIFGRGGLDHQGYENFRDGRNDYMHGLLSWAVPSRLNPYLTQSPLFVTNSQRITIDGLTLRNARNFNVNIRRSDQVTLKRCKVITPPASVPEFTDGYQINACHDTLLENCFAFCNDDNIAAGHYFYSYDDCENDGFTARGFVGWNHRANGIRLGFYTHYDLGSFTFENCDFIGSKGAGVLIHPLKDAPEARRYQRYSEIRFVDCGFDMAERLQDGLLRVDGARMERLVLDNVFFDASAPGKTRIEGSPDTPIRELILRGVRVCGQALDRADLEIKQVEKVIIEE
jgi:hypothetical protein